MEDNGANRIAVFPGASATLTPNDVTASVKSLSGARYFVSQLEMTQEIVLTGLRAAGDEGMIRVLNTAPYSPLIPGIAENTDWLIANEVEMEGLLIPAAALEFRDTDSVDSSSLEENRSLYSCLNGQALWGAILW